MLQKHARKLLMSGKMWQLGHFASRLDFHLVTWLGTEREQAARVENAVHCLKLLHEDFNWPYPFAAQVVSQQSDNSNGSIG